MLNPCKEVTIADARVGFHDNKRVEAESARVRVEVENTRVCEETESARVCVDVESARVLHRATRIFVWRQRGESVPVEAKGRECSCGGRGTRVKSVRFSKLKFKKKKFLKFSKKIQFSIFKIQFNYFS